MGGSLEGERSIYVSIIELAGNSAFDLLNSRKAISILEDSFGTTQMAGALEPIIKTSAELLSFIESAASFRRTATTQKNDSSSRSHAVCRIRIENPTLPSSGDGLLYLIDLAGSEAARDVGVHSAERMRETREINTSLSILKDCIRGRAALDPVALAASKPGKKAGHVPFRQSALTKVLKHVFDPAGMRACKTVVVACVNPGLPDVCASKNTLRYAEMLRVVVPKSKAGGYDSAVPMTWSNEQVRDWIEKNVSILNRSWH
jgi:kinesin family member 2/24